MIHGMKKICVWSWYSIVLAVVTLAILMSLAGFLTPLISRYRPQIESLAGQVLHHPVHIQAIKGSWYLLNPVLQLSHVAVMDDKDQSPLLDVDAVSVHIDLIQSLLHKRLVAAKLSLRGAAIEIQQSDSGVNIVGLQQIKMSKAGNPKATLNHFLQWLIHCEKLQLSELQILWQAKSGQQFIFDNVQLDVRNHERKHRIAGQFSLAQTQGTKVTFHGEFEGHANAIFDWQGELQFRAKQVVLGQWLNPLLAKEWQLASGQADVNLYAKIRADKLIDAQGDLAVRHFRLQQHDEFGAVQLTTEFHLGRQHDKSLLEFNALNIQQGKQHWPNNSIAIEIDHAAKPSYRVRVAQLPISLLNGYLPKSIKHVSGLASQALLEFHDKAHWLLEGDLSRVAIKGAAQSPSINHLNGHLQLSPHEGKFDFTAKNSTIQLPNTWARPIAWQNVSANVAWSQHDDRLHLRVEKGVMQNQDLSLHVEFSNDVSKQNPQAYINLLAGFEVHSTKHLKAYLNPQHTDPEFYQWITQALANNRGNAMATLILRGNLAQFPFKQHEGVFMADIRTHDLQLRFHPKWPAITKGNADVHFENNSMTAKIFGADLDGIPLSNIDINIADMGHLKKIVKVNGHIQSNLSSAMPLVDHSPMHDALGELDELNLKGNIDLKIGIKVPLHPHAKVTFNGRIRTEDAEINLAKWPIKLDQVEGQFNFNESGFHSDTINARLMGEAVQLSMATEHDPKQGVETVIKAQGKVPASFIAKRYPALKKLQGKLAYAAKIDLPHDKSQAMHLYLSSPLASVFPLMPASLQSVRDPDEKMSLAADIFPNQTIWLRVTLGHLANAVLRILDKTHLEKGEVVLGSSLAHMPKLKGLVLRGHMDNFNLAEYPQQSASTKLPSEITDALRMVDLSFGRFQAWSQDISPFRVMGTKQGATWTFKLMGDKVNGNVSLTEKPRRLISVNLDKLILTKQKNQNKNALKPKDIPTLNLDIKDFQYGDKNLGHISLLGIATGRDYEIRDLQIKRPNLSFSARVLWRQLNDRTETDLVGEAISPNLEKLLKSFSYPEFISADKSYFNFSLRWPGAPQSLSLKKALGTLNINFQNGAITHLSKEAERKIGLGKLLGLLSIQSLPRRLMLDFKDLGTRGLPFQTWRNDMTLKGGIVHLTRSELDGPVAAAQLKGNIDLNSKGINLKVYLHPYLTSSLPLIATIAGGPLAGAATWVASKVVGSELKHVAKYRYSITGSWNKPIIQAMTQSPRKA